MPLSGLAEPGKRGELTLRHQCVPLRRSSVEVIVLDAVEAHLATSGGDAQGEMVPLARRPGGIDDLRRVQAGRLLHLPGPVRIERLIELVEPARMLWILTLRVVDDLHLGAGVPRLLRVFRHVKHQPAVAAFADAVVELQFKAVELVAGHEVARSLIGPHEATVDHLPAGRNRLLPIVAEAFGGAAVEEQPPAAATLGVGERVRRCVGDGRTSTEHQDHRQHDSTSHCHLRERK